MKESLKLGSFQTQIIECKTKPILGESTHMMITSLRVCKAQPDGVCPLPPGLHVLHAYTQLKMSSSKVSIIVRNMSDSPIFLKKGVRVAHMVSASPVPPVELSPEMEAALAAQAFHDIFVLDGNELGCTSAIEHEIQINNSEPFKEWFRCIPLPLLDEDEKMRRAQLKAYILKD